MKTKPPPGKLLLEDLKDAIYDWIKKRTEGIIEQESILFRDQSQPLPPRPCVAMKFTSGPQRTGYQDNLVTDAVTGKTSTGGQRTMVLSVQVFGNTKVHSPMAEQLANDLNASLSLQSVLMDLRKARIAVFNQGEVTNLTEIEESEYEERYEFSVMLGVPENQVDDPGYFTSVGPIAETINQ